MLEKSHHYGRAATKPSCYPPEGATKVRRCPPEGMAGLQVKVSGQWEESINRRGGRDTRRRSDRDCESWFRETVGTAKCLHAATWRVIGTFI